MEYQSLNKSRTAPVNSDNETSTVVYYTIGILLSVGVLVGVFFNGAAVLVFVRNKHLRTPTNLFVLALCVCDLFMCLVGMTIPAFYSFQLKAIDNRPVCIADGFSVYFLGLSSMYLLAAISFDRYIVIAHPPASRHVTLQTASLAIGLCFLLGLVWSVMPLVGWNDYVHEGIGVACSVVWESGNPETSSFIFAIFVFCLVLPLCLMAYCYINLYRTIRSIARTSPWGVNSNIAQNNFRLERKMMKTVIIMISAFLISWLPYAIVSFTETFTGGKAMSPVMETIPALMAKASAIWNPIIYVANNIQFRRSFYAMYPFCETFMSFCLDDRIVTDTTTVVDRETRVPEGEPEDRNKLGLGRSTFNDRISPGISHEPVTMETRASDNRSPSVSPCTKQTSDDTPTAENTGY